MERSEMGSAPRAVTDNAEGCRIGIDVGGTKIELVILDPANAVLWAGRAATPRRYEDFISCVQGLHAQACAECSPASGASIGVCIPGEVEPGPGTIKNANSTFLIGRPLQADLEAALGRPVRLANDATCFAVSEAADGAAAGAGLVFGVIIGTGVGGGIAIDGAPWRGANMLGGEWGHNPFPFFDGPTFRGRVMPDRVCYCGKKNCIETFLSGKAIEGDFAARGGQADNVQAILAQAAAGDALAAEVMDEYYELLSMGLASVINSLDPDYIVLGGGVSNIDAIYEEVPKRIGAYVFHATPSPLSLQTRIVKNRWGDSSGVRGAAWLWR